MWRRLAQAFVVWISLGGLIPAALACAQVMGERDCCPPGQQMPCDEGEGQVSVESAACCATPSLAPAAIKAVGEQVHSEVDLSPTAPQISWATLHSLQVIADICAQRWCELDPPDVPIDSSLIYLQTGRLRL